MTTVTRDEWYNTAIGALDHAAYALYGEAADYNNTGISGDSMTRKVLLRLAAELDIRANRLRIRYHREKKRVGIADPPQSKCHQVGCEIYLDDDKFYYCVRCSDPFCWKHVTDCWECFDGGRDSTLCGTCWYKHFEKFHTGNWAKEE